MLRAFPDMKSLTYAETLASTRAGVRRLNELAAAARTAAKEMAQTAKETAQTAVGTAAAAAQTAKETAANAAQSAAQTAKEAAASAIQTARETGISTHQARQRRTGPIKPISMRFATPGGAHLFCDGGFWQKQPPLYQNCGTTEVLI